MAKVGLKYLVMAPMATEPTNAVPTYGAGKNVAKLVSANLTVSNSEGELYADDALAEYQAEFGSGDLEFVAAHIPLDDQATILGATYRNGELQMCADDTPPYMGYGYVRVLVVDGAKKYNAVIIAKCKASVPDMDDTTRGSSISFGTQSLKSKVMAPNYGPWKYEKEFESEAAAKAYIETFFGVATWYNITVAQTGSTATKHVPTGTYACASGGTYEVVITGTASKLYDNGTDKSSSIAGGKYTLTSMAGDHEIVVVF